MARPDVRWKYRMVAISSDAAPLSSLTASKLATSAPPPWPRPRPRVRQADQGPGGGHLGHGDQRHDRRAVRRPAPSQVAAPDDRPARCACRLRVAFSANQLTWCWIRPDGSRCRARRRPAPARGPGRAGHHPDGGHERHGGLGPVAGPSAQPVHWPRSGR
ncbi:hypothetical protein ACRAWD_28920 [Caulobacter segnis]